MKRVGKKLGDTLVEVTIAIGIFSLVAVAIVAVVSGSMSGSQAALENTVAREEIDAQAEALRFIQKNAMTDIGQSGEGSEVWNEIVKNHTISTDHSSNPYKYDINQCSSLYNGTLSSQKAFVINTRMLSTGDASKIVQSYNSTFKTASTYPRIIYSDDNSLIDQDSANTISAVEGIFIIAVKDDKDTKIVDGGTVKNKSAYYDFYIRTCWYAAGSNAPTTISTVVRLYNPDVATEGITPSYNDDGPYDHFIYHVSNQANSDGTNLKYFELDERLRVKTGLSAQFNTHTSYAPTGFNFTDKKMWCWQKPTKADGTCPGGNYYNAGDTYTAGTGYTRDNQGIGGQPRHLYAVYNPNPMVSLNYNNNGGSGTMQRDTVRAGQSVKVKENKFTRNGYKFKGWNTEKNGKGTSYKVGKEFNLEADLTLYAQWEKNPDTITFKCGVGTTISGASTTQKFTSDGNLNAFNNMCNAPSSHDFNYWQGDNSNSYKNGGKYTYVGNKQVTLTAKYTDEITFDCAGGSLKPGASNTQRFYTSGNLKEFNSICNAPAYQSFSYWQGDDLGQYQDKTKYTYISDKKVRLIAVYKQNGQVIISNGDKNSTGTFNANTFKKLKITGKATFNYDRCHSYQSGWATARIYMILKSGNQETKVDLASKSFQNPDSGDDHWVSGSSTTDIDLSTGASGGNVTVSFDDTWGGIFCLGGGGIGNTSLSNIYVTVFGQ